VGRDQDHRGPTVPSLPGQAPSELEAAFRPERDVDEDDIRPELLGSSSRFRGRRGNPRHAQSLPLEQSPRGVEKRRVVIHDEDPEGHATSVANDTPPRIAASSNPEAFLCGG
jgi:hypothetical protein